MAIVTTDSQYYSAIAAAIRQKLGVQTRYRPAEMAEAIAGIREPEGMPLLFRGGAMIAAAGTVAGQPLEGLQVYGKTALSAGGGSLVSAGQGGTLALTAAGANLFDPKTALAAQMAAGLASLNEAGEVVLDGAFNADNRDFYVTLGAGTYCFAEDQQVLHVLCPYDKYWDEVVNPTEKTRYKCYVPSGSYDQRVLRPMVSAGDSPAPWAPYAGRTVTVTVPEGLAGIPVESGGNYTGADGVPYLCDWLDFGAGVRHICCGRIASYAGEEIPGPYLSTTGALTQGAQVVYALAQPQTQPISSNEMALYRGLTGQAGTTCLFTAEPVAGMEAVLRCSPAGG